MLKRKYRNNSHPLGKLQLKTTTENNKCLRGYGESGTLLTVGGNIKLYRYFGKQYHSS